MFLSSLLIIALLYSTLSIDSWFITDSDMPRYDKFRIQEVVLSGDNPVVIGYVLDVNPTDNNRLFTVREYFFSGASLTDEWINVGNDAAVESVLLEELQARLP